MAQGLKEQSEGPDPLAVFLAEAGMAVSVEEIRELVAGVAAAPKGIEPEAWLGLLPQAPTAALRQALVSLEAEFRTTFRAERAAVVTPERLDRLRAALARARLDGFLVPRADEHQGEYVPRAAARLQWLTGFSGSAGLAIVLREKAAIFVDGRYTLQVAAQVPTDRFTPLHLTQNPPAAWLKAAVTPGMRIGFDPWLHTPSGLKAFSQACEEAQALLVPCRENPIDGVWDDRPPPPISPAVAHALGFSGRLSAEKRQVVAATLEGAAAGFLAQPDSIAWLLNVRGGDLAHTPLCLSFALLYRDGTVDWFVDPRKVPAAVKADLGVGVRVRPRQSLGEALAGLGRGGAEVLLDPQTTPVWVAATLRAAGARLREGMDPCALLKACKNAVELEGMRAAHLRDGAALTRFLAFLSEEGPKGRLTELSAADHLEALRAENAHFRGLSFPTISGAGDHGAIVHYRVSPATDRALAPGMLYLVDSGAQYLDGTTDVTRTLAIGTPTAEQRDRFTRVLKGHIALARARFPEGTTGSQLDALARLPLWQAGLDYDHGTGHGVGCYLGVHEGPQRISKLPSPVALRPGMVLSDEPGYYKEGAYGIRIESLLAVTPPSAAATGEKAVLGFEVLTLAPIDRSLVEPSLLEAEERAWLDAYHERVRGALSPLLEAGERAWLESATRPL